MAVSDERLDGEWMAIRESIHRFPYLWGEMTSEWALTMGILIRGGVTIDDFKEALDWWKRSSLDFQDDLAAIRTTALKIAVRRIAAVESHKKRQRKDGSGEDQDD